MFAISFIFLHGGLLAGLFLFNELRFNGKDRDNFLEQGYQ
jgi:hypothetical protein